MKKFFAATILLAGLVSGSHLAIAQAPAATISATAIQTFTNDQVIPLTVAQAWFKAGQSEANFYEMVTQLTVLAAANRGLVMPNDTVTGQKCGAFFKAAATKDPQELLYVVVDSMVQKFGTKA